MMVPRSRFTLVTANRSILFFSHGVFDPSVLAQEIPFMCCAQITQQAPNTLTGIIDRGGVVKVSFFGLPHLERLQAPHEIAGNGLKLASLVDLAGTKASVVQARAEAKDYIDIDALIRIGQVDLPTSLAAVREIYGPRFNAQITLKALSFFDDGDLRRLPEDMKSRLAAAARAVDLDDLPSSAAVREWGRDR